MVVVSHEVTYIMETHDSREQQHSQFGLYVAASDQTHTATRLDKLRLQNIMKKGR